MSMRHMTATFALALLLQGGALAQEPPDFVIAAKQGAPLHAPAIGLKIGMLAVEPLEMGGPILHAPYTAEAITEITQELADGNRIERRSSSLVARDVRGRVRREQQVAAIGPLVPDDEVRMVTISDVAAGIHYSLDPNRKVAIRTRAPGLPPPPPPGPRPPSAAGTVMFKRAVSATEAADVRTEKLGARQIEGVHAVGTKTVFTLPAGAVGNVRPIEVVTERWFSPELQVTVLSRRSDPRLGETVYRLTNIVRAEPDPSLFEIPADYSKEDLKPLHFKQRNPPSAPRQQ